MAIATGINRRVALKKETTWGTAAGAGSAQIMRRTQSTLNLKKNKYDSQELRSDFQRADMRHGTRRVEGTLTGEFSGGSYQTLFEAVCRKAVAGVTTISSLTLTTTSTTITRSTGSWITDSLRVGMVFRVTAALAAGSLNRNIAVVGLTATVITYLVLDGGAVLASEGPTAACTVAVPGKRTYMATSSQTDDSFSIEHWQADISVSELFTGNKVSTAGIKLPATGLATIDWNFMGKDITVAGSAYFTSPTAASTSGIFAAVNGVLLVGGVAVATVTGMNIDLNGNMSAGEVIGSNVTPDIFEGSMIGGGQFTAYFESNTMLNYFVNETEFEILVFMSASSASAAEFVALHMPRCKVSDAAKDDGQKGLVQTLPFDALLLPTTTGYDATTFSVQDSLFV